MFVDQCARAADRLGTEVLTQLANQLGAQKLNLLGALHFDPLNLGIGLGMQLLDEALGVHPRLLGHLLGLGLGLLDGLLVRLLGLGQPLLGLGAVLQLLAHGFLLIGHHPAHRRNDVAPHDEHD